MAEKNHKPIFIVIAGPNGSRKTTITSKVLHHEWLEDAIYVHPDHIAPDKFGNWNHQKAIYRQYTRMDSRDYTK